MASARLNAPPTREFASWSRGPGTSSGTTEIAAARCSTVADPTISATT
jgi:hypothetical protein